MVHDFIAATPEQRHRLWVRINPFDGPYTLLDLAAIMPAHPGGIMLPKANGRADVGVPLVALCTLDVPAYPADALPPELAALPATKPGSRGLQA